MCMPRSLLYIHAFRRHVFARLSQHPIPCCVRLQLMSKLKQKINKYLFFFALNLSFGLRLRTDRTNAIRIFVGKSFSKFYKFSRRSTSSWTVWPDLVKFLISQSLQVFGNFLTLYLLFGKMLSLLWQICDIIWLIFIVANGHILKNILTIWSHSRFCVFA